MQKIRELLSDFHDVEFGFCRFDGRIRPCRKKALLPADAKGIIVAAFPYYSRELEGGNLSVYACVPDYHRVVGDLLTSMTERLRETFPGHCFVWFCDDSPVYEVDAAVRAGLGTMGDHSLLIHPRYGSYLFLGEIITDLPLEDQAVPAGCSHCGRCETACPGEALSKGKVDPTRCLSALTQKKGELTDGEKELLRKSPLIWGCDICQQVCPQNEGISTTPMEKFRREIINRVDEKNAEDLCTGRAFGWRGSGVLLRNLKLKMAPEAFNEQGGEPQ